MADYESLKKNDNILHGQGDMFGGITIDLTTSDKPDYKEDDFKDILKASVDCYKTCGIRGVWIKIPINKSSWIPIAVEIGFEFHHCFPSFIMMTCWLPKDQPNKLPLFATSSIGVGGFVVNDDGELLVVQEKYRTADHWKLPGGIVDHREDIRAAAKREVLEETGIETEFVALVSVRHIPDFRFNCSDLYFVCLLKPLNTNINRDPTEIAAAQWMNLDKYIASPLVHQGNKFLARSYKEQSLKIVSTEMFLFNRDIVLYAPETPQLANKL